jgi:hypothetical protein
LHGFVADDLSLVKVACLDPAEMSHLLPHALSTMSYPGELNMRSTFLTTFGSSTRSARYAKNEVTQ